MLFGITLCQLMEQIGPKTQNILAILFFFLSIFINIHVLLLMNTINMLTVVIPPPQPFIPICLLSPLLYYYFYYVFLPFKTNVSMTQYHINFLHNTNEESCVLIGRTVCQIMEKLRHKPGNSLVFFLVYFYFIILMPS